MKCTIKDSLAALNRQSTDYNSVLDALSRERIFSVNKTSDHEFMFYEECDHYFSITLTREEVLGLAEELIALAKGQR